MNSIFKYVITHDEGKAPCVDNGLLTLCICKPKIRRVAVPGDWVIATGSKVRVSKTPKIVFAAKITKKISMETYALEDNKRSDSIYEFDGFSLIHNGSSIHRDEKAQAADKSGINCLFSQKFWYFGPNAIELPNDLSSLYHYGIGHGKINNEKMFNLLENYLFNIPNGIIGEPNHKPKQRIL